uniref:Uncharacterized protein n=1 Tax=Amphimedon queenslandica TaxID=400682 RepID=A0A1X7V7N1_AMPQE
MELQTLAEKVYLNIDGSALEQIALSQFLMGITEGQVSFAVEHEVPKTLDEAVMQTEAHLSTSRIAASTVIGEEAVVAATVPPSKENTHFYGAGVTLLSSVWQKCCSGNGSMSTTLHQLVSVTRSPLPVRGSVKLPIRISKNQFQVPMIIVDNLIEQGIVGLDFLQIGSLALKPLTTGSSSTVFNAALKETTTVPPLSEVEVAISAAKFQYQVGVWLLEDQLAKTHKQVIPTHSIVSPGYQVITRLINLTKVTTIFKKGSFRSHITLDYRLSVLKHVAMHMLNFTVSLDEGNTFRKGVTVLTYLECMKRMLDVAQLNTQQSKLESKRVVEQAVVYVCDELFFIA